VSEENAEFLGLVEAARWLQVSRPRLTKLVAQGEVPVYGCKTDPHRKLLRRSDLLALKEPQLRPQKELAA
jgi:hypothetical protein